MKFLEFPALEEVNTLLSCIEAGDSKAFGRIESYSCKNTGDDKKLKQHLQTKSITAFSLSPKISAPSPKLLGLSMSPRSPFGPLSQPTSRKTLFYLLATLNAAFPDYDFSDVKPEYFTRMPSFHVVANDVNMSFYNLGNDKFAQVLTPKIWSAIEQVIPLADCDIYSFNPDPDIEPDAEEGNVWSFYYFFYDKKLKRIVFFTCRAV
ncbi:repressor of RNA polymerase III transcription Maf1, partial [Polychytrium aggregatum]|uniref:repressor of RNA polymerase III transcription Maf1 n=1 Tax=Polychytrium aggregatum TaxID=110093 RepID=UPI0022FDF8EF